MLCSNLLRRGLLWLVAAIATAIASPLSAQDMALNQVLIDGEGWQLLGKGYGFTEGPAADTKGNVYFTDIPNSRIHKIDPEGKISVFLENTEKANGLFFGPNGRLYGCQTGTKKIVSWDESGKMETVAEGISGNDLVVTRDGGVYCTEPENDQVWYISPKGEKRVVDKGLKFPNGVILWPDGGTLVVSELRGRYLYAYRVEADGSLAYKQPYYVPQLPDEPAAAIGGDGLTVDKVGRLYACTFAGLQMFDPTGRLGGVILKPQNAFLANVCFGGPKMDYLYVTCSDKVYRRKTKSVGVSYTPEPKLPEPKVDAK